MLIRITGKVETIEKLEQAQKLISEAAKILWGLPNEIGMEIDMEAPGETSVAQDNQ